MEYGSYTVQYNFYHVRGVLTALLIEVCETQRKNSLLKEAWLLLLNDRKVFV